MNYAIAAALLLLLCLLTLVSYVDRVYTEIGRFLSREFQENIAIFEQKVEPRLGVSRARAVALHGGADADDHGCDRLAGGVRGVPRARLGYLRDSPGHAQPGPHHHPVQPFPALCFLFADRGANGWCAAPSFCAY